MDNSAHKLEYILQQFSTNQVKDSQILINKTDIENCNVDKCYRINLLEFVSEIGKYIPRFVNYKIEINRQLLDSNNKLEVYQLEKAYNINQYNQIIIGVSLEDNYTSNIEYNIAKPYIFSSIVLTLLTALGLLYGVLLNHKIKRFYIKHFENEYEHLYKKFDLQIKEALEQRESKLLKRIWDLEYINDRDLELNRIFSEEANRLTLLAQNQYPEAFDKQFFEKESLCTLSLHLQEQRYEKIKVQNLLEIFSDRFVKASDKLNFDIKSDVQQVSFSSKAFLYQLIYSIASYLSYLLTKQSPNQLHNIRLEIGEHLGAVKMVFKFDGKPITSQNELMKFSSQFFKQNVNPFLLNVSQIFEILMKEEYDCKVFFEESNIIKIEKKKKMTEGITDNVVKLRPKKH